MAIPGNAPTPNATKAALVATLAVTAAAVVAFVVAGRGDPHDARLAAWLLALFSVRFGGTVLASFLFVFGTFHASG